jgi:hypothetical protein
VVGIAAQDDVQALLEQALVVAGVDILGRDEREVLGILGEAALGELRANLVGDQDALALVAAAWRAAPPWCRSWRASGGS